MNSIRHLILIFHFFTCLVRIEAQAQQELDAEEKILFNAKIFTANPAQPYAEAVAIISDKIVAVGDLASVKKKISGKAILIDMKGQCLLPGFVDSHTHPIKGGISLSVANVFEELLTIQQLRDYCLHVLKKKTGMTGEVLLIYGINITTWSDIPALNNVFNHGEFAGTPVFLRGSDGHTAWANYQMLEKAGITRDYLESLPAGKKKYYGTGAGGKPTGFVADSGLQQLYNALPKNATDYNKAAELALAYNNKYGITAWLDASAADINEPGNTPYLDAYSDLAKRNKLPAHVVATIVADADGDPLEQVKTFRSLQQKFNTGNLAIKGFKIFADGVIEYPTQTAALSRPYLSSGENGTLLFNPEKFSRFVTIADRENILVHVHAIGDRAVTETLDGFEKMRSANGKSGIPHTITHLQIVQPTDFKRFYHLGILASYQLLWAFGDVTTIDIVKPYITPQLFRWQYPARSMLNADVTICGASDWPVSSGNPFEAIARAETRNGPLGVLNEKECMPRLAMFYVYTINAAKALMMDKEIGSIKEGKLADLICVDRNIFTVSPENLAETKVLWTMFEGKIIYRDD